MFKQILTISDPTPDHFTELKGLLYLLLDKYSSEIIKAYKLKNKFNFSRAPIKNFLIKDAKDYSQNVQNYLSNLCDQSERRIKWQED